MPKTEIGIGLLGLGVIGGQVARVLRENQALLEQKLGIPVILRKIKVLPVDLERPQARQMDQSLFTTEEEEFFATPGLDIIVELIGGEQPAFDYQQKALKQGRHVVTANKEVIAKHGIELMEIASRNGLHLRYEAAVGGGIPIIAPLMRDLVANRIKGIYAIINGTTNYILSHMASEGIEFKTALKQAQALGYAESNPKNDIEGFDAAYKLAILATLAFQSPVKPEQIQPEGISKIEARDFQYARELGLDIKLMAIAKQHNGEIEVRVHPVFIPRDSILAKVDGVYNAILIDGDLTGEVTFMGKGAGPGPTSSAVVADILEIGRCVLSGHPGFFWKPGKNKVVKPLSEVNTRYYIRMTVTDRPGVLAQIANVLGGHDIGIASVIQKESYTDTCTAEIVIMTHHAREHSIQQGFHELKDLDSVKAINNFVRVEA